MQNEKYERLTFAEREEISRSLASKKPISAIAKELGRNPSTIFREVKRNRGKTGYRAFSANKRAQAAATSRQKGKSKISKNKRLSKYVLEGLNKEWSPEEISKRIKNKWMHWSANGLENLLNILLVRCCNKERYNKIKQKYLNHKHTFIHVKVT